MIPKRDSHRKKKKTKKPTLNDALACVGFRERERVSFSTQPNLSYLFPLRPFLFLFSPPNREREKLHTDIIIHNIFIHIDIYSRNVDGYPSLSKKRKERREKDEVRFFFIVI